MNQYVSKAVTPKRPVINHKVEQLVRAVYFGLDGVDRSALSIDCTKGTAIEFFGADDWVEIGVADVRGYRLKPSSNSACAVLGFLGTVVLKHLTQLRLNGEPVVAAKGDNLIAKHCAVVQACRDVVFNWDKVELTKGKPVVVDKPLLRLYYSEPKPKLFT